MRNESRDYLCKNLVMITHPSGAKEFYCEVCGHRYVVGFNPVTIVVLDQGNQSLHVPHSDPEIIPLFDCV
jgi:hypothetical protein